MRHTYECQLRWADMDLLGHVNNVRYIDYLQEARIDFFRVHHGFTGRLSREEAVLVVGHEVEFVAPLVFRRRPVYVDTWVSRVRMASFTMSYEVWSPQEGSGERVVHLRASTVLAPYLFDRGRPRRLTGEERGFLEPFLAEEAPRAALEKSGTPRFTAPIQIRFTDVDIFGHVNNVRYFELFQEARIQYLMSLHHRGEMWSHHVVARTDVQYHRQVDFRHPPYDVHCWIAHLGSRSFTVAAELRDGDTVLAAAQVVMVTFDAETQRSAPMTEVQRQALAAELAAGRG